MLKVFEENKELSRAVTAESITLTNLYELEYAEGEFLRYIASSRELSFEGNLYLPSAIQHTDFKQDESGKINDITLTVGNADRVVQYYINKYDLVGKRVKITQVFFGKAQDAIYVNTADTENTEQTGTWVSELPSDSLYGNSLYGSGSCSFSWKTDIEGEQEISIYFPTSGAGSQPQNVNYEVYSNDVLIDTAIVDQTQNNGSWLTLGTYVFDGKVTIKLNANLGSGEVVAADGVRFFGPNGIESVIGEIVNSFTIATIVAKKDHAIFTLSIGLDALRLVLPSRRIYSKSCSWTFKDESCRYFGSDTTCAKTFDACRLKSNVKYFGGFPGVINERLYL